MKIFEFYCNIGLTETWICASSYWEAKAFYLKLTECHSLEGCKVTELPKEEWKDYYILDEPEDLYSICERKMSFAEYMEKYPNETDIIAIASY